MMIEIDIDNLLVYARVAHLLDQADVLPRIEDIRRVWNLNKLIPYEEFDNWIAKPHIDFTLTHEAVEALNASTERLETDMRHGHIRLLEELSKNKELSQVRTVEYELEHFLFTLGLNFDFKMLILRAIVCGKVRIQDFEALNQNSKEYEKWLFDEIPNVKNPYIAYDRDTKQEIKRDREWYWKHESRESYLKIAKKYKGHINENDFRETVKKQIKRYKLFLKVGTFSGK